MSLTVSKAPSLKDKLLAEEAALKEEMALGSAVSAVKKAIKRVTKRK